MHLRPTAIELGVIEFSHDLDKEQLKEITKRLVQLGFEILQDKKSRLVEKVKTLLIKKLQQKKIEEHFSIRKYLSARIKSDYTSISKTFSESEEHTIEKHFILLRLEKAKELITYGELSMVEIAKKLGYASVQHLSSHFKSVIGISPNAFKANQSLKRRPLDKITP
ncbi:MAG TPA: helix-turn-helix domain-containing protein [Flavisolibacter sp.]|nr:helix-turn-helix domain-containing protein [Flavisolibacter sp.]